MRKLLWLIAILPQLCAAQTAGYRKISIAGSSNLNDTAYTKLNLAVGGKLKLQAYAGARRGQNLTTDAAGNVVLSANTGAVDSSYIRSLITPVANDCLAGVGLLSTIDSMLWRATLPADNPQSLALKVTWDSGRTFPVSRIGISCGCNTDTGNLGLATRDWTLHQPLDASRLSAGTIDPGRFARSSIDVSKINASGIASSATYLRGDGTWSGSVGVNAFYDSLLMASTKRVADTAVALRLALSRYVPPRDSMLQSGSRFVTQLSSGPLKLSAASGILIGRGQSKLELGNGFTNIYTGYSGLALNKVDESGTAFKQGKADSGDIAGGNQPDYATFSSTGQTMLGGKYTYWNASLSVGKSTTAADSTAIADFEDTQNPNVPTRGRGILFPRMSYARRIAIIRPAPWLQVTQTDSVNGFPQGNYMYDGIRQVWRNTDMMTTPPNTANVTGPATSTFNEAAVFSTTNGKALAGSGLIIDKLYGQVTLPNNAFDGTNLIRIKHTLDVFANDAYQYVFQVKGNGAIVLSMAANFIYLNDAEADADNNLPHGGIYQIKGSRNARIKP